MNSPEVIQARKSARLAILQIVSLALLTGIIFLFVTSTWLNRSIENIKAQQRSNISQYVVVARSTIEPILEQVRAGKLSRDDALTEVRNMVRRMTYVDAYGPNYIFMSSYDGTMLVQPYEPQKELTNMWDLKDIHGVYIIQGLVNTARENPEGGFFTYYYYPPDSTRAEEKLSFVVGIPELNAYIGTGTYMGKFYAQQENLFTQVRWLLFVALALTGGSALLAIYRLNANNNQLIREIEERRKAQAAAELSRQNMQIVFDSTYDAIFIHDYQGNILKMNQRALKMFGVDEAWMLHKKIKDISAPLDTQNYRLDDIWKQVQVGIEVLFEWKVIRPLDQSVWDCEVALRPVEWYGQGVVLAVVRDISERKRAEQTLFDSESRYRAFFEGGPDGVVVLNPQNGKITVFNDQACQQLGYTREEFSQLYVADIEANESPEEVLSHIQKTMDQGYDEFETVHRTKQGEIRNIQVIIRVIEASDHSTYYHCIWRDITEQKRYEQKIIDLNNELERRVQERTAQLEAANQELQAFSYSISHDLRSPLRSIDGFSHFLQSDCSGQLDEQGLYYLKRIRESTQYMAQLIDDLLNLSRISQAKINCEQVNLSQLAQEIAAELRDQDKSRQVEFEIEENLVAYCDAHLIRIALFNLMDNAYKFTSQKEKAQITVGARDQDGERIYFVSDNGSGFNMTHAGKLFAPFQRLHSTQDFPGTGIGLSIVNRIIARHGGRIWPQSEVDQGTTFYFTLEKAEK